jgi:hypothetical protein
MISKTCEELASFTFWARVSFIFIFFFGYWLLAIDSISVSYGKIRIALLAMMKRLCHLMHSAVFSNAKPIISTCLVLFFFVLTQKRTKKSFLARAIAPPAFLPGQRTSGFGHSVLKQ